MSSSCSSVAVKKPKLKVSKASVDFINDLLRGDKTSKTLERTILKAELADKLKGCIAKDIDSFLNAIQKGRDTLAISLRMDSIQEVSQKVERGRSRSRTRENKHKPSEVDKTKMAKLKRSSDLQAAVAYYNAKNSATTA